MDRANSMVIEWSRSVLCGLTAGIYPAMQPVTDGHTYEEAAKRGQALESLIDFYQVEGGCYLSPKCYNRLKSD